MGKSAAKLLFTQLAFSTENVLLANIFVCDRMNAINCKLYLLSDEREKERQTEAGEQERKREIAWCALCCSVCGIQLKKSKNIFANKFNIQNILYKWFGFSSGLMLRQNAYTKTFSQHFNNTERERFEDGSISDLLPKTTWNLTDSHS